MATGGLWQRASVRRPTRARSKSHGRVAQPLSLSASKTCLALGGAIRTLSPQSAVDAGHREQALDVVGMSALNLARQPVGVQPQLVLQRGDPRVQHRLVLLAGRRVLDQRGRAPQVQVAWCRVVGTPSTVAGPDLLDPAGRPAAARGSGRVERRRAARRRPAGACWPSCGPRVRGATFSHGLFFGSPLAAGSARYAAPGSSTARIRPVLGEVTRDVGVEGPSVRPAEAHRARAGLGLAAAAAPRSR